MIIQKDKILNLSNNLSQMNEVKGRSLWQDAKIRFFKNKAALFSLVTLLIVLLLITKVFLFYLVLQLLLIH